MLATPKRYSCLVVMLLLSAGVVTAQRQKPYGELGFSVGGMNYIGDLNGQSLFGTVRPAANLFYRYNIDSRWAVTIAAAYGTLVGGNPDVQPLRNLSFSSHLCEASLRAEFNFVSFGFGDVSYRTTPYLFCGIGIFHFNPQATYTDPSTGASSTVDLQPLGTEGQHSDLYPDRYPYNLYNLCIPFGLGFKYRISKTVIFAFEYGFRKTWTDYIDDVSTLYVDPAIFADDEVALRMADRAAEREGGSSHPEGAIRGDDSLDDWYAFFNASITIDTDFLFGWMRPKRCYNDKK
ncbi:MAG: hypothetical protein IJR13_07085 [Bacteroidales bacterium]|nr:hypothetical protein [Bacteroidales bacterium]